MTIKSVRSASGASFCCDTALKYSAFSRMPLLSLAVGLLCKGVQMWSNLLHHEGHLQHEKRETEVLLQLY